MAILDHIIGLYAPHACFGCGAEGSPFCTDCYASLPVASGCCYRCGRQAASGRTCVACRSHSSLVSVNSATMYEGAAKELIGGLKFSRMRAAAEGIGRHLAETYADALPADVLVVPVPTARRRVRGRGYDQAALIARSFARYGGFRYACPLIRLGVQEQKGADRLRRQEQLRDAYRLVKPQQIRGAKIVIIDDVMTTGSTLEEVGRTLRGHGASAVAALVFARA